VGLAAHEAAGAPVPLEAERIGAFLVSSEGRVLVHRSAPCKVGWTTAEDLASDARTANLLASLLANDAADIVVRARRGEGAAAGEGGQYEQ
jgi:hypothetical protein